MKIKRKNHTLSSKENKQNKVETPSMASTIKETIVAGFGLGVGSEIAHRAVSAVLGPRQIEVQHQSDKSKNDNRCQEYLQKYEKCLKENSCSDELENYQKCLKSI
jgi:dsRNA-specific ribonuclease